MTLRRTTSGRNDHHDCSALRFVVLMAAAFLVATSPGVTLGADGPDPASEQQAESDGEKNPQEDEEKKGFWDRFKDPEDGKLDLTAGGEQGAGFFPIAIPFNEPATGPGLVLALGYFHPTKGAPAASSEDAATPPTVTFGAVAGTTNGTWFAAGGHHHVWKEDTIRYLGAIGGGSANLTFFGFGDQDTSEDEGIDFNIKALGLVQQAKFRIAELPVFVGTKYIFATTDTTFDADTEDVLTGESDLAGLSALVEYDTRDTVFTPNKGMQATVDLTWYSEALGGDFDFGFRRHRGRRAVLCAAVREAARRSRLPLPRALRGDLRDRATLQDRRALERPRFHRRGACGDRARELARCRQGLQLRGRFSLPDRAEARARDGCRHRSRA